MTKWIGAAIVAAAMALGNGAAMSAAAVAPLAPETQKPQATSTYVGERGRYYHHHVRQYAYRPYYPYYYGRPYYYSPGPFLLPAPPSWGYGWEWW